MNSKTRGQIFISILITTVIAFGTGYFAGNHSFFSKNNVQAGEKVDLTPFWKVWNTLDEKFVSASTTAQVSEDQKLHGAIQGLVDSLGDPYTVFFTPEKKKEFEESIGGAFSGVGMEVGIQDGILTIVAPLKNSPAQKAGILSGDKIISIEGKDASGMSIEEAVSLIRGKEGTVVTLQMIPKGATTSKEVKLTRAIVTVPTIETEQKDDVFIIRIYNFGAGATNEFRQALRDFVNSKNKKLILDLRDNPGGYLDAAVDIASWFLPAGKVIVSEDFGTNIEPKVFRSKGYDIFGSDLKMLILIDEGSASASEILAGALREQGIARLVGQKSYGKGSVQEVIEITPDTALKVTIARWLTPNGNSISHEGIKPDVEVEFDSELYKKSQKDTQLLKAIELLK